MLFASFSIVRLRDLWSQTCFYEYGDSQWTYLPRSHPILSWTYAIFQHSYQLVARSFATYPALNERKNIFLLLVFPYFQYKPFLSVFSAFTDSVVWEIQMYLTLASPLFSHSSKTNKCHAVAHHPTFHQGYQSHRKSSHSSFINYFCQMLL